MAHVTSGGLFRENIRRQTELGRKVQPILDRGLLVPDELTVSMVLDRIAQPDARQGFVLDGFPRNVDQARALDEALAREGKSIDKAIYIKVSTDELVRRLAGRWNCSQCGAVYHDLSMRPKKGGVCDSCGSELHQREDDRPDVVRIRLEVNLKETKPLLEYYGADGKLTEVNGDMEVKQVKENLLAAMCRPQKVS